MRRLLFAAMLAFASSASALTIEYFGETFGIHETADGVRCTVNFRPDVTDPMQLLHVFITWPDGAGYQDAAEVAAAKWAAMSQGTGKPQLLAQVCDAVRADMSRRAEGRK